MISAFCDEEFECLHFLHHTVAAADAVAELLAPVLVHLLELCKTLVCVVLVLLSTIYVSFTLCSGVAIRPIQRDFRLQVELACRGLIASSLALKLRESGQYEIKLTE